MAKLENDRLEIATRLLEAGLIQGGMGFLSAVEKEAGPTDEAQRATGLGHIHPSCLWAFGMAGTLIALEKAEVAG